MTNFEKAERLNVIMVASGDADQFLCNRLTDSYFITLAGDTKNFPRVHRHPIFLEMPLPDR